MQYFIANRGVAEIDVYIQAAYDEPSDKSLDGDLPVPLFACLSKDTRLVGVMPSIRLATPCTIDPISPHHHLLSTWKWVTKVLTILAGRTRESRSFTSKLNPSTIE